MTGAMDHRIEHSRAPGDARTAGTAPRLQAPRGYEGYDAALDDAAVYPRGPRGILLVAGADAVQFLHGILTNDIKALEPGQACYAAYLTPQGRMIADMDLLRRADDLLLDVEPDVREPLAQRLDASLFTEDVRITDQSESLMSVGVYGPAAGVRLREGIEQAGGSAALPEGGWHVSVTLPGGDLTVLGTRSAGLEGFHLFGPPGVVTDVAEAVAARGAPLAGELAVESLRVEGGVPRFGADMTHETIPLEAGIETRAISTTKGCYVGQEVIVRILHRGHGRVARRLMGLRIEGETLPVPGTKLRGGGKDVGHVTSAVRSPRLGAIALGYVHRDFVEPGTRLQLADSGREAVVSALPMR